MLTSRFENAMVYAAIVHAGATRKGTAVPYLSHLLSVAALVLEYGGHEDEAIAGLLHDAVEDAGGLARLGDIRQRFGERVAQIVDDCTDAVVCPKPPWRERKETYIAHLKDVSKSSRLVSACDKLHNGRSIVSDLRQSGNAIWSKFNGKKEGSLWYYSTILAEFQRLDGNSPVVLELARTVQEMIRVAGDSE